MIIAAALTNPRQVGQSFSSWTFERLNTYLPEELGIGMKQTRMFEILQDESLGFRHQETWFAHELRNELKQSKQAMRK